MLLRSLTAADHDAYRPLRLRCVTEHPDAFGASPEDEHARSRADVERMLDDASGNVVVMGAFEDDALIGMMTLRREARLKSRSAGNAAAVGLYEAFGFERFGLEPRSIKWAGGYADSVHMILEL